MRRLRWPLRVYVLAVMGAGILALAAGALEARPFALDDVLIGLVLFVVATLAELFPVHISVKTKVTAADTPTFAAALLLGPLGAMLVAAGSTLVAMHHRTKMRWYNRGFNAASALLGAGAGAATYGLLSGGAPPTSAETWPIVAAALVKFVTQSVLVELVVDLQLKRTPFASWWTMNARDLPNEAGLYLFGAIGALSAHAQPLILIVVAVPMALVLLTLRESAKLREQTRAAILELADIIDLRDPYTHGHSQRVAAYAERLARRMKLQESQVQLILEAARVHDIGKIGTNDMVLLKPGPLDAGERAEMEKHTEMGHRLLRRLPEFVEGAELVLSHHERLDGKGYPRGLVGNEVPLEVSVISVADTYDAMSTDRPYRKALPWPVVRAELLRERGTQWREDAVDAFVAMMDDEVRVAKRSDPARTSVPSPTPAPASRSPVA